MILTKLNKIILLTTKTYKKTNKVFFFTKIVCYLKIYITFTSNLKIIYYVYDTHTQQNT